MINPNQQSAGEKKHQYIVPFIIRMTDRHQRSDDTAVLDDEIFTNKSNFVLFISKGLCGFSVKICSFGVFAWLFRLSTKK